ncbi:tRNA 2-selenouridine(34) synthase MnmH [Idiomarina sp. HP20-50]|uniref:tRNA 2-selenouridine(34) synthase MnmH n=1 Tax=Idiomarina sp. HP20-50 TaxID=3070813 RepID=UPI00294B88B1|nr:tRNA 2-selenouridine(34) synthase MnmH [Idiomarina sp. HP20-50]MDV6315226.1 tRNA 2-selenouridine(34) synthase MnmH [Idiomarina sp. HP20-50]
MFEQSIPQSQFDRLFIDDTPLLDLRAPAEFAKGAFTKAVNHPLMTDAERAKVGTCYKHHGQTAAMELGHQLVSGNIKQQRMAKWQAFFESYPSGAIYCFRGGLRSQIVQQWLRQIDIDKPRIEGGYKALRQHLIQRTEELVSSFRWIVVSGRTGCQKTEFIKNKRHSIDLEGLAHHRGSAFGRYPEPQPSQIDFENRLAIQLIKLKALGAGTLYIEDEGSHIGSVSVPWCLQQFTQNAERHTIESTLEQRIEVIYQEYVIDAESRYSSREQFEHYLLDSLSRNRKRLGDLRFRQLFSTLQQALSKDSQDLHKQWIKGLLVDYYDPMYDYQMKKR